MSDLLARLVTWCGRHFIRVMLAGLVLMLAGVAAAWLHLGISTDTDAMFADNLVWKQRQAVLDHDFPQYNDLLVFVINGATPEETAATASELATRLAADPARFHDVRRPDASPYFAREGLLFLDRPALTHLLNRIIDAQPFLGQLVIDPSARGLMSALALVATGLRQGQADLTGDTAPLAAFHRTLSGVLAGKPAPLSWQNLLGGGLAAKAGPYDFVLAKPVLDYDALEPGGRATALARGIIAHLPAVVAGRARVRITGSVALSDEEFATVAQGAAIGLGGSLVLMTLWLFLALGSWRLVVPVVLTLLLGLSLTAGFAALAVGRLNLVSVAFAILFVGIAVDFAIQFGVRWRDQALHHASPLGALAATGGAVGGQILLAALSTAAGFLAFVPTAFLGVAELGLIAGVGMLIAFAVTLTFLPACLTLFRPAPFHPAPGRDGLAGRERAEMGMRWAAKLDAPLRRARLPVLVVCVAAALGGVLALGHLPFDADPLHTKNPNTEAMRTLHDLAQNPLTSPYTADILAASPAAADALAAKLSHLPDVAAVRTLDDFVPDDQKAKLALIADTQSLLAPTLDAPVTATPVDAGDLRLAVRMAAEALHGAAAAIPPGSPLLGISHDLAALQNAPDATLLAMNTALTRFLPRQLAALRTALSARAVTRADLPPALVADWRAPDGKIRVQAVARESAQDSRGLHRFVRQVQSVAPEAGGSAVTIIATSDTIIAAFRTAAIAALLAISVILLGGLRRFLDAALVLAPLLFSGLLTALIIATAPLTLNYANIIALPLLLGVGVSFNVYFVMNWRRGERAPLGSATARAVLFSALTTGTAFGSLALSAHPGTASMGALLLVSLGCTLIGSFAFLPALLACFTPR